MTPEEAWIVIQRNLNELEMRRAAVGISAREEEKEAENILFEVLFGREGQKRHNAEWIISSEGFYPYCSHCRSEPENGKLTNYCPECGADMKNERKKKNETNLQI